MSETVKVRIQVPGEKEMVLEGRGAVCFVPTAYRGSDHLTQVQQAMAGSLNPADVSNSIMSSVRDEEDGTAADYWRKVLANVLAVLWADKMQGQDITGKVTEAEAFAIHEMDLARKRTEGGDAQ